jgi:hypothetical protein
MRERRRLQSTPIRLIRYAPLPAPVCAPPDKVPARAYTVSGRRDEPHRAYAHEDTQNDAGKQGETGG